MDEKSFNEFLKNVFTIPKKPRAIYVIPIGKYLKRGMVSEDLQTWIEPNDEEKKILNNLFATHKCINDNKKQN